MSGTYCPQCDTRISIDSPIIEGRRLTCRTCGVELEVVDTDPLEVNYADWREEQRFEEKYEEYAHEYECSDESVSDGWQELTPLHRAAYGSDELT